MTRVLSWVGMVAIGIAAAVTAGEVRTVKGEVVDVHCHTKHGAKGTGADHADCAKGCAEKGAPLAILTEDGDVYAVTGSKTDNRNQGLIEYVAKRVEASGEVSEADGKKTINVAAIHLAR
jgi:hypothetical protein